MKPRTLILVSVTFLLIGISLPQASMAQTVIEYVPLPVLTLIKAQDYGPYTRYSLGVSNWQLFPKELFEEWPEEGVRRTAVYVCTEGPNQCILFRRDAVC
jgi:hypothetical protein